MPSPIFSGSISATRLVMTPSASSRCRRFQHGVDDRPTRWPISATESEASCWTTARILRSMASILSALIQSVILLLRMATYGIIFLFCRRHLSLERKIFYFKCNLPPIGASHWMTAMRTSSPRSPAACRRRCCCVVALARLPLSPPSRWSRRMARRQQSATAMSSCSTSARPSMAATPRASRRATSPARAQRLRQGRLARRAQRRAVHAADHGRAREADRRTRHRRGQAMSSSCRPASMYSISAPRRAPTGR